MIPGSGRTASGHVTGGSGGGDGSGHHQGHSSERRGMNQSGVRFADGSYEEEMEEPGFESSGHLPPLAGEDGHPASSYGEYGAAAHPMRKSFHQMGFWEQLDVFKRAQRKAYATALATAQLRRPLPIEPWMLGQRINRAFVFSYFGTSRKDGAAADEIDTVKPAKKGKKKKKKKKSKKMSQMKSIFGDVMPHDFYPGGKRNLDGYAI